MSSASVFMNNHTQAVRLPAEARFPAEVKRVEVRILGRERILSAAGTSWDSFFDAAPDPAMEHFGDRGDQTPQERENLW